MARNQNQTEVKGVPTTVEVKFVVGEKKEIDPRLQQLRKMRDTIRGNLLYALSQLENYSAAYQQAVEKGEDELTLMKLELKVKEQQLRVDFYKSKLADTEEKLLRYRLEKRAVVNQ